MSTVSQTEVIAKKKSGLKGLYIFALVFGAFAVLFSLVIFIISVILDFEATLYEVFLPIVGTVLIIISVVFLIRLSKIPENVIVYENGELHFPDGSCKITELKNVEYRQAFSRYGRYKWGKIILVLNDRTVKYNFVEDVVQVHNRLIELMFESKQNN